MKKIGVIIALLMVISLFLVPLTACEEKELGTIEIPGGEQGEQGATGPQGPPGPAGPQGEPGPAGEDGALWYAGSGAPAATTGVNGDLYLDADNGDVYQKVSGAWTYVTNLEGPRGLKGPEGPMGPIGSAGENPQIVVVDNASYGVCYVYSVSTPVTLYVYGSNFVPTDYVSITICEGDEVLAEQQEVNVCGAFGPVTIILNNPIPPDETPVSVKAYVDVGKDGFDDDDILWACWPLEVDWDIIG